MSREICKCCERLSDTRFGVCFDCANFESLVSEKIDMNDNPVKRNIEASQELNIVHAIIKHYKESR